MQLNVKKGSTDRSVYLYIIDSTAGTPEQGVNYATSGLALWYRRVGAAATAITPAELAALTTAHTDGGIIHIDDGLYRVDVPDAAFATGVSEVTIGGACTDMIVLPCVIQLVNYDPEDGVRLGLTALPNAAADAAGGLPISDAGSLDLDAKLANTNEVTAARMGALTDWIDGGRLDLILDARAPESGGNIAAILTDTGTTLDALIKDIPTVAEFEARTLPAADYTIVSDLPVPPTVSAIADQVWDEAIAGHAGVGSTGAALSAAGGSGDPWSTALPGAYGAGTAGAILGTTIPASIAALPTDADVNAACDTAISDAALATAAAVAAIPVQAKKNTALANFGFAMTDSTNHEMATGKTVTCERSIDGSAFAAGTLANVTEIANGIYNVDFLAADLNGDVVVLRASATDCDDTFVTIVTAK